MLQIFRLLQSWGLHSSGMWCLILLGDWYLIFQDNMVVTSHRVKKSKNFPWTFQPFKTRPPPSLKKSGTNIQMIQDHIPEEQRLCSAFFKLVIVLNYAYSTQNWYYYAYWSVDKSSGSQEQTAECHVSIMFQKKVQSKRLQVQCQTSHQMMTSHWQRKWKWNLLKILLLVDNLQERSSNELYLKGWSQGW